MHIDIKDHSHLGQWFTLTLMILQTQQHWQICHRDDDFCLWRQANHLTKCNQFAWLNFCPSSFRTAWQLTFVLPLFLSSLLASSLHLNSAYSAFHSLFSFVHVKCKRCMTSMFAFSMISDHVTVWGRIEWHNVCVRAMENGRMEDVTSLNQSCKRCQISCFCMVCTVHLVRAELGNYPLQCLHPSIHAHGLNLGLTTQAEPSADMHEGLK